jgi:hypothetical protein
MEWSLLEITPLSLLIHKRSALPQLITGEEGFGWKEELPPMIGPRRCRPRCEECGVATAIAKERRSLAAPHQQGQRMWGWRQDEGPLWAAERHPEQATHSHMARARCCAVNGRRPCWFRSSCPLCQRRSLKSFAWFLPSYLTQYAVSLKLVCDVRARTTKVNDCPARRPN